MPNPVHQLHDAGSLKRREREQQQETGDKHRPDEEWQAHPSHSAGSEVDDCGDEIDRSQQRRGDQTDQADQPLCLSGQPLVDDLTVGEARQRGIVRPAGFRGSGFHEERGAHDDTTDQVDPVADHVQLREGHVHRTDLEGRNVVSEGTETKRHNAEEDHDRAVHRTEHIVGIACHLTVQQPARFPCVGKKEAHPLRQRLVRVGDAPAHDHHQIETEGKEQHGGDSILQADGLVIGGENVFPEPAGIVVMLAVVVVRIVVTGMGCCVGAHR